MPINKSTTFNFCTQFPQNSNAVLTMTSLGQQEFIMSTVSSEKPYYTT